MVSFSIIFQSSYSLVIGAAVTKILMQSSSNIDVYITLMLGYTQNSEVDAPY